MKFLVLIRTKNGYFQNNERAEIEQKNLYKESNSLETEKILECIFYLRFRKE
jgi:hypothetical protein